MLCCKQTFHISDVRISQKVKGVVIWNFQHTTFIWRQSYWQIFESALVYLTVLFKLNLCVKKKYKSYVNRLFDLFLLYLYNSLFLVLEVLDERNCSTKRAAQNLKIRVWEDIWSKRFKKLPVLHYLLRILKILSCIFANFSFLISSFACLKSSFLISIVSPLKSSFIHNLFSQSLQELYSRVLSLCPCNSKT